MSNRTIRINELVQRELSDILHKRYQQESVAMTITEVRVAPDLRDARVFVSIIGNDEVATAKLKWLRSHSHMITQELGRRIVIKYMPRFEFVLDKSTARGTHLLGLLDDLDREDKAKAKGEE